MSLKMYCGNDNTLLAIIHGDYERGDVPPKEAYEIIDGKITKRNELVCTSKSHPADRPQWKVPKIVRFTEDASL